LVFGRRTAKMQRVSLALWFVALAPPDASSALKHT